MNLRQKSNSSQKTKYQSYYFKKMQTQGSINSQFSKTIQQTSQILQRQISKIQHNLSKRNSMYTKTLRRKSEMQQEQERSRSDLKSRLQQKMRKSHHNMLQHRQKSSSSLSSRLKAQNKKIQEIRKLQRTIYNDKYQKSKQISNKTQKFFQQLKQKRKNRTNSISVNTSYLIMNRKNQPLFSPINRKRFQMRQTSHQKSHHKLIQNPQYSKTKLSILKTPRQSILQKQSKKINLQKSKQNSFLREYIKKLQCIESTRKKVQLQKKVPQQTVAKFINRQISQEQIQARKKYSKSSVKQAVNNKGSFSQLYKKKLQEKKQKKSFFLSQSIAQGDNILKDDFKRSSKLKLNKLIRQTQNQLARKQNFRYMEKFLTKKF